VRGDDGDEAKRDKAFVNLLQVKVHDGYILGRSDRPRFGLLFGRISGFSGSPPERPCPERELPI